jgi:4a-hydroxytetrahydrobiopterin dehydratase
MALLGDDRVGNELSSLPGWAREGNAIVKRYDFPNFVAAIDFVRKVADRAEAVNHHPDIAIHYNKVTLTLSTHSEGGITEKDIDCAKSFDAATG